MTIKTQFNGMVMLASYIQRLYVNEQIKSRFEEDATQLPVMKDAFESLNAMMPMVAQTKMLAATQGQKLEQLYALVKEQLATYFEEGNDSYAYKLRIVTSTLFAEKLMVQGILHLGEVFGENINPDFKKRLPHYENRTEMMNKVIAAHQAEMPVKQDVLDVIDKWYAGIAQQQTQIVTDLEKVALMIGFRK